MKRKLIFRICLLLLPLAACLEPVRPAFQIEDGFYLVEGRILAGAESEIRIRESNFREVALEMNAVAGAEVVSVEEKWIPGNMGTGGSRQRQLPATRRVFC